MKLYGTFVVQAEHTYSIDITDEDYNQYLSDNPDFDPEEEQDVFDLWNHFEYGLGYDTEQETSEIIEGELIEVAIV